MLDDGVIVARGTHDQLKAASPTYARLFALEPRPAALPAPRAVAV
jgi:ABC-type multidrug transport system fused ATPase/permease subunit